MGSQPVGVQKNLDVSYLQTFTNQFKSDCSQSESDHDCMETVSH